MKRVLLLGAGHAQLSVLTALAAGRLPGAEVRLVSPNEQLLYSGMVPGLVAGRHALADCSIAIAPLAAAAGVTWQRGRAIALDAAARVVTLADGQSIDYDLLSLNTGPSQNRDAIAGAREHALFLRPIEAFAQLWQRTRAMAEDRVLKVTVIGGGAAGVEIALAVQAALAPRVAVNLLSDSTLLAAYSPSVRERAMATLRRAGIELLPGQCTAIDADQVHVGTMRLACDVPIIATGGEVPPWLSASGLATDEQGFVRVNAGLQSSSHPDVFVAGDLIVPDEAPQAGGGVHAVRAGPVLAENLRRWVGGGALLPYRPQRRTLNLLATGDGGAIASWGPWSLQGRLMGWWKDRIDRAFVASYRRSQG